MRFVAGLAAWVEVGSVMRPTTMPIASSPTSSTAAAVDSQNNRARRFFGAVAGSFWEGADARAADCRIVPPRSDFPLRDLESRANLVSALPPISGQA